MVLVGGAAFEVGPKRNAIVALLQGTGGIILTEQNGKTILDEKSDKSTSDMSVVQAIQCGCKKMWWPRRIAA
jgi:hypothetical protein